MSTETKTAPSATAEEAKPLSAEEKKFLALKLEKEELELEERKLTVALRRAELEDATQRLDDRALKLDQARSRSIENGKTLSQTTADREGRQDQCNHKKGGNGLAGYVRGQGNDANYSIIRHTYANGDTWVFCQRCRKTWKPPVASEYKEKAAYDLALATYKLALDWPTTNQPSGSAIMRFSDNGVAFRERMSHITM